MHLDLLMNNYYLQCFTVSQKVAVDVGSILFRSNLLFYHNGYKNSKHMPYCPNKGNETLY